MKRSEIIRLDIRPYDAVLYFARTRKSYKRLRAKYTDDPISLKDCNGISSDFNGCSTQLVGVFDGSPGTLAHEIGHAVIKVLESRGVPIDTHTSEATCYLVGDLVDQCWQHLHPGFNGLES